ncbi:MAG TPA: 2-C-methyl-D-erythritol 2,4-cyclodiphosphate synthase [Desulfurobacteriaceae bacterium]|nr:2-C-methyl-D-erythritol 2,4-cyclodiphosphate synthase [Desulfurobacteriaceae bacterium]
MLKVGIGFDAHKFVKNRKLIICQVEIPYKFGLEGHSDADVALHALCDAILGALGEKDIGHYFPPTDPKLKDISSKEILDFVLSLLKNKGFEIVNIDLTLIAQEPKFSPYIDIMKDSLSKLLEIPQENIGLKATTAEKMLFTEGIGCMAVVLLKSVNLKI